VGSLGEAIDEEVEEQLEALVGVVVGEAVGELVRHPARAEDGQDAVDVAQGVGAPRDAPDREPDDVVVGEDGCALAARDLFELNLRYAPTKD
jgi:hypothetical protein